jgi:hypothetical protein
MATHPHLASPLIGLALGTCMTFANSETAADESRVGDTRSAPSSVDGSATRQAQTTSVWIELEAPPLSSLHGASKAVREELRRRIGDQQDAVMRRLKPLGAEEQSRTQVLRNALAVRIPLKNIEAARQIAGVRSVKQLHDKRLAPSVRDHQ